VAVSCMPVPGIETGPILELGSSPCFTKMLFRRLTLNENRRKRIAFGMRQIPNWYVEVCPQSLNVGFRILSRAFPDVFANIVEAPAVVPWSD